MSKLNPPDKTSVGDKLKNIFETLKYTKKGLYAKG